MTLSSTLKNLLHNLKNNEKFRLLACAASGILSSLPFFFEKLFIFEWLCFVPFFMLFYTDKNITAKRAFLYGFLLHFTRSCIVLTWFKELYSMSAVDVPPFIMIAVIFLGDVVLSALQSVPFGICSILINHLHKSTSNCALRHIFSASFFAFTELFQTLIEETCFLGLIGFPWVVSYVTQHRFLYAIQSASVFGAIFITFIIILVNSLIAHAIFCEKKAKIVGFRHIFRKFRLRSVLYCF